MTSPEVQLYPQSVHLVMTDTSGQSSSLVIDHPTFDDLATKVREAVINKKGRTIMRLHLSEVEVGDYIMGRPVTMVNKLDMKDRGVIHEIVLDRDPYSLTLLAKGHPVIEIERLIQ